MNRTIILLGATGSGKGTQAHLLVDQGHFHHLSTGDLVRAEIMAGTELGSSIKQLYDEGKLVPDELIIPIFEHVFKSLPEESDVLLDGFPRDIDQVNMLEKLLPTMSRQVDRVIMIDVTEEEVVHRLGLRRICPSCRRIFHQGEETCPFDLALLQARSDDDLASVQEKLRIFQSDIKPVLDYFESLGKVVHVNGEQSVEGVATDIESHLSDLL
jgi:adenylate kinase